MSTISQHKLMIIDRDLHKLRELLENSDVLHEWDRAQCSALEEEIERATVVSADQIPPDVVTMHSRVRIVDMRTGEQMVYQIVYPREANFAAKKISILAPIGMALLGYRTGAEIEWTVPSGTRWLRIEAVEHQPKNAMRPAAA
jgi:regulator of nucleoside diphosphate kinase